MRPPKLPPVRAIATGGAGFIGSHVVDALVARGDEIVVLDDLSSGRADNLEEATAAGARLIEADISDPDAVSRAFAEARPEQVFHLAAQIDVRRSISDPVFDSRVNVGGTINLLEAARDHEAGRFVFASTGGAIYGEGKDLDLPVDESAPCRPDAPYGQSKLAAEGYLSLYSRLYGLSTVALRLGNVYGPRQDPHGEAGVVAIFSGAMLAGDTPKVFGDGEQTRDYVYVGDVVSAFVAAADSEATGEFNVGTGVETSVLTLGQRIASLCDTAFEPRMEPARPGEVQRIAIDCAKATNDLRWSPEAELDGGLEVTVGSFRE